MEEDAVLYVSDSSRLLINRALEQLSSIAAHYSEN